VGQEPVEVIAAEVRPGGQSAAVGPWLVEGVEHEVEQIAQAVGHGCPSSSLAGLIAFDIMVDGVLDVGHGRRMPSWSEFEGAAPELAASVRARLDAHVHKTLATVRRDGSPRISGSETVWADGELWIGSMWQARKAADLQHDPRFALHSGSDDPPDWTGDAKLAGMAEEVSDPERVQAIIGGGASGPAHLFRLDLREVSTVGLDAERSSLVISLWTPAEGVRAIARS
jgi:hypothetical protein